MSEQITSGHIRCANCGVYWTGSHICPTVPQTSGSPFQLQPFGDLAQILQELRRIRELLERRP